ncbi:MAG: PEP-CTERM sorting domain-containing protein [Verrucomicrobiales bacterium]
MQARHPALALGLILAAASSSHAAVISTGSAWVPPSPAPGNNRLLIGLGAGNSGSVEINGGSTVSSSGDFFGSAAYVGVDGGTGTLLVTGAGSGLTMDAGNAIRIGANASNSTGTVRVESGGFITTTAEAFVVGVTRAGSTNNRGSVTVDNGTINVNGQNLFIGLSEGNNGSNTHGTVELTGGSTLNAPSGMRAGMGNATNSGALRVTGTGNTVNIGGSAYLNFSGGSGEIYVESGNTVNFANLFLQGSDVGSGLPAPSGAGTIGYGITDWATVNPIAIAGTLNLNGGGGSHLLVESFDSPAPGSFSLGDTINLLTYSGQTGSNFDSVGSYFYAGNGYGFTVDQSTTATFLTVTNVPEPSRALLVALGVACAALRRRRS